MTARWSLPSTCCSGVSRGPRGSPWLLGLQAARVLFGLAMLVMAYLAIARFVHQVAVRRVAFLLAAFSGGTGWIFFALGATGWMGEVPVDVHFPDATTYWTLFTFPNYSLSVALMLFMTLALLAAFAAGSWRWAVAAGLAGAALSATHPSSLVVFVVFGVYLAFLWWSRGVLPVREGVYLSLAVLLSAPVIVYELAVMRMNWAFQVWSDQNYCTSPSPLNMLLSFGAPAALAAAGAVHLWRRGRSAGPRRWAGSEETAVPVIWFLAVPVLMYVPTSVQRRLLEGWHIPLSILAAIALVRWVVPWLKRRLRWKGKPVLRHNSLLNGLLVLSTPSSMLISLVGIVLALQATRPLYLRSTEVAALDWLRQNAAASEVVLTGLEMGNIIPGQTGNRVVIGHPSETIHYDQKGREIISFFSSGESEAGRLDLLARYNVRYLWFGQEERALGPFDPSGAGFLEPAMTAGDVVLYRVKP